MVVSCLPGGGYLPLHPSASVSPSVEWDHLLDYPQGACQPSGLTCQSTCLGGRLDPVAAGPREP